MSLDGINPLKSLTAIKICPNTVIQNPDFAKYDLSALPNGNDPDFIQKLHFDRIDSINIGLDDNGTRPNLEQLQTFSQNKPKFSVLMYLQDYVAGVPVKNLELHPHYDADISLKRHAEGSASTLTRIALKEFRLKSINAEFLSQAASQFLEKDGKDLFPDELSQNQKVYLARVLYDAKNGLIDDELLDALSRLRYRF
jgi:hypothetical protein